MNALKKFKNNPHHHLTNLIRGQPVVCYGTCRIRGYGADAERKGLGTPATRADVIEKLVKDGKEIKGTQYKVKLEFPKKKK